MTQDRIVGELGSPDRGRTVFCIGSIHGSEPAGARALERVVAKLEPLSDVMAGAFTGVRGNVRALEIGRRYVDRDLNRMWEPSELHRFVSAPPSPDDPVEYAEARELYPLVHRAIEAADGPICFLDLHTTSSPGPPFMWLIPSVGVATTLPQYGIPIVHDSLGRVSGTAGQYVAALGHEVVIAEGGQHDDPAAIAHHEALLWITLVRLGLVSEDDVAIELAHSTALLRAAAGEIDPLFGIIYHHKITDEDGFEMLPGYRGFQEVSAGELVAKDSAGPIYAPESGRILMPLYRPPCDDGFMIIEPREAWPA